MAYTSPQTSEQHRFLNLCMLLMSDHPRIGADLLAVLLGEITPFKKGWNHIPAKDSNTRDAWVFIDPSNPYFSRLPPNVDSAEPVHIVRHLPLPLAETTAWKWIISLGDCQSPLGIDGEVLERIVSCSEHLDFPSDPDAERVAVKSVLKALTDTSTTASSAKELAEPVVRIVYDYLSFKCPGMISACSLAASLTNLGVFISQNSKGEDRVQTQFIIRRFLANQMANLLYDREGKRSGSFDEMTYLAALYGKAALLHSSIIRTQFRPIEADIRNLNALDQNVDELLCHEVMPYFVYLSMPSTLMFMKLHQHKAEKMTDKLGPALGPQVDVRSEAGGKYAPFDSNLMTKAFASVSKIRELG